MIKKLSTIIICFLFAIMLSSCARQPGQAKVDPYEKFNRAMFAFNMDLDHLVMRPVAKTYNFFTPYWVQHRVTDVFNNVEELTTIPNDILQGKFLFMLNDFWRLVFNTTLGLGGLFDVAKHIGLRPHYENFGLTLAYWEHNEVESPYLVLPLFGPNTTRSAFGMAVDYPTTPYAYIPWKYWYYDFGARFLYAVNFRSSLLPANRLIDTAFDPYIFVRNAYLTKRNSILRTNQIETYRGKETVSNITMTAQDFEATAAAGGASDQSTAITNKEAAKEGYILDYDDASTATTSERTKPADSTKTTESKVSKPANTVKQQTKPQTTQQ